MTGFKGGLKDALKKLSQVLSGLKRRSKWKETGDIEGHKPRFKISCRHCGAKMFLRYSQALAKEYLTMGIRDAVNIMEYKCPRCAWVAIFYVDSNKAYLKNVIGMRGGLTLYIPPIKRWEAEHEEIKKRLDAIGYI